MISLRFSCSRMNKSEFRLVLQIFVILIFEVIMLRLWMIRIIYLQVSKVPLSKDEHFILVEQDYWIPRKWSKLRKIPCFPSRWRWSPHRWRGRTSRTWLWGPDRGSGTECWTREDVLEPGSGPLKFRFLPKWSNFLIRQSWSSLKIAKFYVKIKKRVFSENQLFLKIFLV